MIEIEAARGGKKKKKNNYQVIINSLFASIVL